MHPFLRAGRTFTISDQMSISIFQLGPTKTELMPGVPIHLGIAS